MGKKLIILGADFSQVAVNVDEKLYTVDELTTENGKIIVDNKIYNNFTEFGLTDYIDITGYKNLSVPYCFSSAGSGFDANHNYVEAYKTNQDYPNTEQEFVINSNVKYIRLNIKFTSPIEFYALLFND